MELSHGRIEQRAIRRIAVDPLAVAFPCIRSVLEIQRQVTVKKNGQSKPPASRLFLSDRTDLSSGQAAQDIRLRWNIENKNHHPRDATFLEDKCRCRTGNTAANLALLGGVVLTLWKKTRPQCPAPAFIANNQRNINPLIASFNKNQRLTNME